LGLDLIYCPIVLNQLFVAIGRFNASRDYYSDSSGYFREHRLQEDVSFSNLWRRSSQVVRASGCQCTSRNSAEFDPSILKHNGMLESDIKKKSKKIPLLNFSNCNTHRNMSNCVNAMLYIDGTINWVRNTGMSRYLFSSEGKVHNQIREVFVWEVLIHKDPSQKVPSQKEPITKGPITKEPITKRTHH